MIGDHCWGYLPRTSDAAARQPFEVKLTADSGVRATRVWNIIAVERHHVTERISATVTI